VQQLQIDYGGYKLILYAPRASPAPPGRENHLRMSWPGLASAFFFFPGEDMIVCIYSSRPQRAHNPPILRLVLEAI
jgi:hypothetical protein